MLGPFLDVVYFLLSCLFWINEKISNLKRNKPLCFWLESPFPVSCSIPNFDQFRSCQLLPSSSHENIFPDPQDLATATSVHKFTVHWETHTRNKYKYLYQNDLTNLHKSHWLCVYFELFPLCTSQQTAVAVFVIYI